MFKIAVVSSDGKVINQHFGRATSFYIFSVNDDYSYEYIEERETNNICRNFEHDDEQLKKKVDTISDCNYVIVSKIGSGAESELLKRNIEAYMIPDIIHDAIEKLLAYIQIEKLIYK